MPLHLALRGFPCLELLVLRFPGFGPPRERRHQPPDLVCLGVAAFVVPLEPWVDTDGPVADEPLHREEVARAKQGRGLCCSDGDQRRRKELVRTLNTGRGCLLVGALTRQFILAGCDSAFPAGHRRSPPWCMTMNYSASPRFWHCQRRDFLRDSFDHFPWP